MNNLKIFLKVLKIKKFCANINMHFYNVKLYSEVNIMNLGDFTIIGGVTGGTTGNTSTWEGDYGFIWEFIKMFERLLMAILNFINGIGAGTTTTPDADGGAGEEVVPEG